MKQLQKKNAPVGGYRTKGHKAIKSNFIVEDFGAVVKSIPRGGDK